MVDLENIILEGSYRGFVFTPHLCLLLVVVYSKLSNFTDFKYMYLAKPSAGKGLFKVSSEKAHCRQFASSVSFS